MQTETKLTSEQCALVIQHLGTVKFVYNKVYSKCGPMTPDIFQAGCLGLCQAAVRYDSMSNDASFTSYAYLFVSGCIRREIRGESGFHVSDKHTGQVEKPLLVDDDSLDRGSNKERESFLYDATMLLEGEDRHIVSMLLKGYQQAEIGRELGIGANGMVIRCKSIVDRLRSYTHD